jgi:putative ABC transport system permease protein
MLNDVRFALRTLAKAPGFATVAVLTIALGIGANSVIFSLINAVLLKPLPYREPQRLVLIQERILKVTSQFFGVSAPDVLDIERSTRSLDSVAAFQQLHMNLSGVGVLQRANGARVSSDLFGMLGARPALGRTFTRGEDTSGQRLLVLSYGLWQDRFGADPRILGSKVLLDGQPYVVIGVMPRGFAFPPRGVPNVGVDPVEFWIPMSFTPEELADVVDNFNLGVLGRVRPGTTRAHVNQDMAATAREIEGKYSSFYKDGFTLEVNATPLSETITGPVRPLLLLLLGVVGFVLLIACVNVANLLLTRGMGRRQEMAIRAALGATRGRVIRQLLVESTLLAGAGGVAGLTMAWLGLHVFVAVLPASIPHSSQIGLDWRVLAFAAILSLLTGIVFGAIPAFAAGRSDLRDALTQAARSSTASAGSKRLKNALVVCEISFSMVLLMGAGLFIRSYLGALRINPGFQPERVLAFGVSLPEVRYTSPAKVLGFYRDLTAKLDALPGVRVSGGGNFVPLTGSQWNRSFVPEGWPATDRRILLTDFTPVYGAYLQALGIPLVRGRYFTDADHRSTTPVVIVSETLARRYWPNQDAIGKRFRFGGDPNWVTVIGVVADVKAFGLEGAPLPHTYQPVEQLTDPRLRRADFFAVRTNIDPAKLFPAIRRAVASIDKDLPVANLRVLRDVVDESLKPRRFNTYLVGLFAALALLLALIGIYGVIAYSVTVRIQEIGIRMALGAERRDVLGLFLRESLLLCCVGIAAGSVVSLLLARYIGSFLYGVSPRDTATLGVVASFFAAVALLATYIPARRATRLDPMQVLRHQ